MTTTRKTAVGVYSEEFFLAMSLFFFSAGSMVLGVLSGGGVFF
jgi:hypothetical protein